MNPQKPPRRPLLSGLPGSHGLPGRLLYVAGGLLVLVILIVIIKGAFGGSNFTGFVTVAQDQQELIHLATNATQQQTISAANLNFASTVRLAMTTSQANLIQYLLNNHHKLNNKTLSLKVSAAADQQLTNAVAATTYDQTFQQIMNGKLKAYSSDLRQAYQMNKGPKGRALLNDDYNQAQLLLTQLDSAAQ